MTEQQKSKPKREVNEKLAKIEAALYREEAGERLEIERQGGIRKSKTETRRAETALRR